MWLLALLVVGVLVVGWQSIQASQLFYISVRHGRCLVIRGRVPVRLLQDFADIVAEAPITTSGTIRAYKGEHHAELRCDGAIDPGREQRMRNCFLLYPASQLRAAPPIAKPSIGQLTGIAWLAWMLSGR